MCTCILSPVDYTQPFRVKSCKANNSHAYTWCSVTIIILIGSQINEIESSDTKAFVVASIKM